MRHLPVESFARSIATTTQTSVQRAAKHVANARRTALADSFRDPEAARSRAAAIKSDVLNRLGDLLDQLTQACESNGVQVHRASDGTEANQIIERLCRSASPNGGIVVKAKSMATEEIHLNAHLEKCGYEVVETDLGEFVVQIDHDLPSHIVAPIIHKSRFDIAKSFDREGLGPYTEVPEELAMQARAHLRDKFRQASIGISGVNFAIAETGRIVLVENEGNNRLSTTAPDVHIAVMGIEKVLPREADLSLFLPLLAGSATGQHITSYTHLISGPRRADEVDGPRQVHLILLDNGRSNVLEGPYRDILRCIRCGACLNICPVYRQSSGHAYGHVYPGPLGAVLAPALEGVDKMGHLAKASTLCGACEEVCPVKIPIPHMLLQLRDEVKRIGAVRDPIHWGQYAFGANHPTLWRTGLKLLPIASKLVPHPMKSGWTEFHDLPERKGRSFREWWSEHRSDPERESSPPQAELDVEVVAGSIENEEPRNLWQEFKKSVESNGGEVVNLRNLALAGESGYIDVDVGLMPGVIPTTKVWEANYGVTRAEFAIAETGSLVIAAGKGRSRLASLAPPTHVAIVSEIVPTLADAFARMPKRTTVIITGTSRTSDIEGVPVRGVHGPRKLIVARSDGID